MAAHLVDSTGAGIGGATVTVGGMPDLPATTTLTEGSVGVFTLVGLPDPGTYTVTFTRAGYADQTVPLTCRRPRRVTGDAAVAMSASVARITGTMRTAAAPVIE